MIKKRVIEINVCNYGSTGNIAKGIAHEANQRGIQVNLAYPFDVNNLEIEYSDILICSKLYKRMVTVLSSITGLNGCFSIVGTLRLIHKFNTLKPDLLHLHNLHNSYINLPILFTYIKKINIPVIWTLHDCWAITGRCPYFDIINCNKWITGCFECPYPATKYPPSFVDNSKNIWKLKRKYFSNIRNMTLITPSNWLGEIINQSFLKSYPIRTIYNGIDLSIFKPTKSDFREVNGILSNKYMILGVASFWGTRKGLDVFVELSQRLDEESYQIVLVGSFEQTDSVVPNNILLVNKTKDQQKLVQIYSSADLFVNPTREEVLGMVNIEALACGTPGITFKSGGSPECYDETCGVVVDCDDIDSMEREIIRICTTKPFRSEDCVARAKKFDMHEKYKEYIDLYNDICI